MTDPAHKTTAPDIADMMREWGQRDWPPSRDCAAAAREIENLRALVKRLTDVAESLASESADPGTEALAAIYCGRNLIYG